MFWLASSIHETPLMHDTPREWLVRSDSVAAQHTFTGPANIAGPPQRGPHLITVPHRNSPCCGSPPCSNSSCTVVLPALIALNRSCGYVAVPYTWVAL